MSDVRELMKEVELVAIRPVVTFARLSTGPVPELGVAFENQFNVSIGFMRAGELEFAVVFKVDCRSRRTRAEKPFARYVYQVAVQYRAPRAWPDEIVSQFANMNTPVHAWPYARQFVHSSSVQLGLHPLLLPALRVGQPPSGTHAVSPEPTGTPKAKPADG